MKTKSLTYIFKRNFTKKSKPGHSIKDVMKERLRNGETYIDYKEDKNLDKYPEYTKEEVEKLIEINDKIKLMELSDNKLNKYILAKRFSLFVGIPVSILISLFFNTDLSQIENTKIISFESLILLLDYALFIGGCSTLFALRNVVIVANYIPKQQMVEFIRLNLFSKQVRHSIPINEIQRVKQSHKAAYKVLKNKKTLDEYSMLSKDKFFDIKLYNTLFPKI
jgi:hypothetical protein